VRFDSIVTLVVLEFIIDSIIIICSPIFLKSKVVSNEIQAKLIKKLIKSTFDFLD